MLTSLALIFIVGLLMSALMKVLRLPGIIGMLVTGIILGPYCLDLFDEKILLISPDLRQMALIIILLKAGLSLRVSDLRKVGRPALLMSFLPALFEILAFTVLGPWLLGLSFIESALMGAVMSAVSPAVVVPRMTHLMDGGWGVKKSIPQLIIAGSSLDDIFVIVLFTTFLGMAEGGEASLMSFTEIPISIVLGIGLGILVGLLLSRIFERAYSKKHHIRNSLKVIVMLGVSFLLVAIEDLLEGSVPVSGLLAIVAMASTLAVKSEAKVTKRLSEKFGKLWLAAEVILFVLVGAAVDIRFTFEAGLNSVLIIFLALIVRSIGTWVSVLGTDMNRKERLFCVLSYLPKATVQAAIGSVPYAAGLPCGAIILSVAVVGIILTAPIGAFAIDCSYVKLLSQDTEAGTPGSSRSV